MYAVWNKILYCIAYTKWAVMFCSAYYASQLTLLTGRGENTSWSQLFDMLSSTPYNKFNYTGCRLCTVIVIAVATTDTTIVLYHVLLVWSIKQSLCHFWMCSVWKVFHGWWAAYIDTIAWHKRTGSLPVCSYNVQL